MQIHDTSTAFEFLSHISWISLVQNT